MSVLIFFVLASVLIGSAIVVVAHPNPVYNALALALNLTTLAVVYVALDATFLAASQIIVYAGAIIVLVLFVIMLLNAKPEPSAKTDFGLLTVSVALGATLLAYLAPVLRRSMELHGWSDLKGSVQSLGVVLFKEYLFPFQLAGVLLVVGIVGAILLAKQRKGGV